MESINAFVPVMDTEKQLTLYPVANLNDKKAVEY